MSKLNKCIACGDFIGKNAIRCNSCNSKTFWKKKGYIKNNNKLSSGTKFNKLTVIRFYESKPYFKRKNRPNLSIGYFYLCLCECGKEVIVLKNSLIHGETKSCGCIRSTAQKNRYADIKNHPKYIDGRSRGDCKCIECGKSISKASVKNKNRCIKCYTANLNLENNPNWKGGISFLPYSIEFNKHLKQKIRERDNYTCQYCGLKEEEHIRGNKKTKLIVHHIDYNKQNCKENNLISLCLKCHLKTNSNRDYWYAFYKYIMENK